MRTSDFDERLASGWGSYSRVSRTHVLCSVSRPRWPHEQVGRPSSELSTHQKYLQRVSASIICRASSLAASSWGLSASGSTPARARSSRSLAAASSMGWDVSCDRVIGPAPDAAAWNVQFGYVIPRLAGLRQRFFATTTERIQESVKEFACTSDS